MAKAKIITSGIVHLMRDGRLVTLRPGDKVPDWANESVTNPALFKEVDVAAQSTPATTTPDAGSTDAGGTDAGANVNSGDTPAPSKEPTVKELKDQAKALGVSTAGNKEAIAARIAAKLAESQPAGDDDGDDAADDGDDEENGDRAALEARANELGIEFDENTTDEELNALIDDQE